MLGGGGPVVLPGAEGEPDWIMIPGRQLGGPVWSGGSYLVGEAGPEIFRPRVSGMIVPAPVVNVAGGSTASDNRRYTYNMRYNERARNPINDLRMLQAAGLT